MGRQGRKAAQNVLDKAREGVIRVGHLGIYEKLQKDLHAARERLAGREELLRFDEIRRALDAKIEELTAVLQDPSVADHVAISEGVYKLLLGCEPLYLALSEGCSVKEACDALDSAGAVLDGFADEDAAYKEYRRLNGGWIRDHGKWVKLNAKDFAKRQAALKKSNENFAKNPYKDTKQTTAGHEVAFRKERKTKKKHGDATLRKTKKARVDDDEPTPSNLSMRVRDGNKVRYCVQSNIFEYAPEGYSNGYTTKKKAMELAELCLANRPAGRTLKEMQAARAQKGVPRGVHPQDGAYKALVRPKKRLRVMLAAPGGGYLFDTAKAAGKAIKKYEDAGSPTKPSDPLYDTLVYSVYRRK